MSKSLYHENTFLFPQMDEHYKSMYSSLSLSLSLSLVL